MRTAHDGLPEAGPSARTLGVRRDGRDINVDDEGNVEPFSGGMSVAMAPEYLPDHRRPASFGGTGRDPVWMIRSDDLGEGLRYREDEDLAGHAFIEPTWTMPLEEYEERLELTREAWSPA
jgi:hypothetical protein